MASVQRSTNTMPYKTVYSLSKFLREMAESTSMHGLQYIVKKHTLLAERVLWVSLFMAGIVFAMLFSRSLWENWKESPVITSIQTANYPMNTISFPTVTICSVNKVSTHALAYWMETEEGKNFQLDQIRRILEIMTTNRVENEDEVANLGELLRKANITSDDGKYEEILNVVSPNCTEMIVYCSWEGKQEECGSIFETEATDDGFCCSFNSIVLKRGVNTPTNKTLRKATSSGVYAGLTVYLDAELHDYNVTSSSSVGFKVSIQEPNDFARTGRIGFLASPGLQIDAAVTGETQIGGSYLKHIQLVKRLCVTYGEINLKYFEDYTGPYCQLECLVDLFYAECHCIPYYYPVRANLTVCSLSSYVCLQRMSEYILNNQSACYCPDTCNNVWYGNEISSGMFPNSVSSFPQALAKHSSFQALSPKEFNKYARQNFVKLNVFFKTVSGIRNIIEEKTTWTKFISATGGLLGLGFGFSILSAAELFYFLLVRWFYYWYHSKKQPKKQLVNRKPTYPLVPILAKRRENLVNFYSDVNSSTVNLTDKLSSPYQLFNLNNRVSERGYVNERPTMLQTWIDY